MILSLVLSFMLAVPGDRIVPTDSTEELSIRIPTNFEEGHRASDESTELVELVETPETVENWSKLITVFTFFNVTKGNSLEQIYAVWLKGYRQICPGPPETVRNGTVDGRPALESTLFCPADPKTGKPESLTAIFVKGEANLLGVQVAFRRSMTSADKALVHQVVASMKVCDAMATTDCSVRKATGFRLGK